MGNKRGAVVWPLPSKWHHSAVTELCTLVGASTPTAGLHPGEFDCRWGDMNCIARRLEYGQAPLLEFRFWQSDVLEKLSRGTFSLEADPLFPLACSFRDACEQLEVAAAFVRVRLVQDEASTIEQFVRDAEAGDIDALCDEMHAAVFVSDRLGAFPFERLSERECMDTPSGMILFAGRDEGRWY
ncbi:MAG: hypothetical protein AAF799_25905 [Myxococcota bacterium]